MGLSAQHVGELVRELAPLVEGAPLRDLVALPPRDLMLVLEAPGASDASDESRRSAGPIRRLRLSAAAEGARLHLQIGSAPRHEGSLGPFFRRVAQELDGAHVRRLTQVAGDRIVRLELVATGGPRSLVAEIFGRSPNLVLLDAAGTILTVLAPPRAGTRAAARLAPGAPWEPPGAGTPGPAAAATESPPLAESLPPAPDPEPRLAALVALAPLSWQVESTLGKTALGRHETRLLKDLETRLGRKRSAAEKNLRGLEERGRTCADAERVRMDAELLTAHMGQVRRGMSEVELPDAFDPEAPPRRVTLDPGLSPRRNAERLFARYRKLTRTAARLPEELERARSALAGLDDLLSRTAAGTSASEELEREAVEGGWLPPRQEAPKRRKPEARLPYFRFTACKGSEIRVGRSARENDELTFKVARGNDLWMHTSDSAGSHVVLCLAKGAEPDPEEVLDAAHLAVHFSPLREAGKAGVHVARRKEVRKPRKAPAGLVTLSGGRVRTIRIERERIERLLATRGRPRPGTGAAATPQEPGP